MKDKINLKNIKHGDHNIDELLKLYNKYMLKTAINTCGYADEDMVKDLVQEGSIGLWRAHERYDATKGNDYHQWLMYGIKQGMMNFMTDKSRTVRVPANVIWGKEELDESKMPYLTKPLSMDQPIGNDGIILADIMPDNSPDGSEISFDTKDGLEKLLLGKLKVKDIRVIELYYYSGYSIYEISKILHCTPQNINDRLGRCVNYLQDAMGLERKKVVKSKRNYRSIVPKEKP